MSSAIVTSAASSRSSSAARSVSTPIPASHPAAAALPNASAARTIGVHLTPFAPGCERLHIDNPKRWRTFWSTPPETAVRAVLRRLGRAPGDVRARCEGHGDVGLAAAPHADLLPRLSLEPGQLVPFAIFFDGLTLADLTAVLGALSARGWTPPTATPA